MLKRRLYGEDYVAFYNAQYGVEPKHITLLNTNCNPKTGKLIGPPVTFVRNYSVPSQRPHLTDCMIRNPVDHTCHLDLDKLYVFQE